MTADPTPSLPVARFDRAAQSYDAWAEHHRAIADALFELPALPAAPRRLLDVGCGTGLVSLRARQRYPQAHLAGLDQAPAMLEAYARRFPHADAILGDVRHAPLPQELDLIVSSCVFQWLPDYTPTLRRLRDALRPQGGVLAFAEPVEGTLPEFTAACAHAGLAGLGLACRSAEACLAALAEAGFRTATAQLRDFPVTYPDARSALRSFSGIGALPGKRALAPGRTRRLMAALTAVCAGPVTLTYRVLLVVATPQREPAMKPGLLIVGTDTDAGKTVATCSLVAHLRLDRGLNILPAKPVQTGCVRQADGSLSAPDLDAHLAAAGMARPGPGRLRLMAPYCFEPACSPHLAAAQAGVTLEPAALRAALAELAEGCDGVVAETAGGLLAPLNLRGETMLDLARLLGWPVLVVAANRLGCINHALLTLRVLADAALPVLGVLMTQTAPPAADPLSAAIRRDNPQAISRFGGVQLLGEIPYLGPSGAPPVWRALAREAPALVRALATVFP